MLPSVAGPRRGRIPYHSEVVVRRIPIVLAAFAIIVLVFTNADASLRRIIPAKAAVVMDSSGAVLYAKYPKAKLAPASTVKLMTAMVVLDHLSPNAMVAVSKKASRVRTIPPGICPGEEMTVAELLHLALMKSINSAAVALAEATAGSEEAFAALMNRKACEIGAYDTLFANASGLPKAGPQYSTASDLVLIMRAALAYPLIREILATKEYAFKTAAGRELFVENSNHLLWEEQTTIIGKTGYTGNARHCFVGAVDTDRGMVFTAVLGARSRSGLWRAAALLADVGVHPELAQALETFRAAGGGGRAATRKDTAIVPVETPSEDAINDIQRSRLQGVF
jgi:D-alanyl-D-alanine carboxypeptidase (penicillin-binding protein 5/6)